MNPSVAILTALQVLAVPAATLAALAALWRPWRSGRLTPRWPLPAALAVGLIVAELLGQRGWAGERDLGELFSGVGAFARGMWEGLWPMDATRRLPHAALLAVLVAGGLARLPESSSGPARMGRVLVRFAAGLVIGAMVTQTLRAGLWSGDDVPGWLAPAWILGIGAAAAALWTYWGWLTLESPGATVGLSMSAVYGGLGVMLLVSGNSSLGLSSGAFGLAVAAVAAVVWRRPDLMESRAAGGVSAVGVAYLAACLGLFADEPSPLPLIALGVACSCVGLVLMMSSRQERPVFAGGIQLLVLVGVLGLGVFAAANPPGGGEEESMDSMGWDSMSGGEGGAASRLDPGELLREE